MIGTKLASAQQKYCKKKEIGWKNRKRHLKIANFKKKDRKKRRKNNRSRCSSKEASICRTKRKAKFCPSLKKQCLKSLWCAPMSTFLSKTTTLSNSSHWQKSSKLEILRTKFCSQLRLVTKTRAFCLTRTWLVPLAAKMRKSFAPVGLKSAHCSTCLRFSTSPLFCAYLQS